jgi:hypothetical protein
VLSDAAWAAARRTLFVVLPLCGVCAPLMTCSDTFWSIALGFALATGLLWLLRVGFQPWYSDLPLAGLARWATAVFLGACVTGAVLFGAYLVAALHCGGD